ncbi:hypothetical protein T484DRAFT_1753662 [Baffinella frigidus]|nr:hypothetical protein T484DRAFT_1753662 [Cryptophyta sp. CCMP2293]
MSTWEYVSEVGVNHIRDQPEHQQEQGINTDINTGITTETLDTYLATKAPWYLREPVYLVQKTGLDAAPFVGVVVEIPGVVSRLLRCDVEALFKFLENSQPP